MCVPQKSGFIASFLSQNIKSWSFSVPFFTLLIVGIAQQSPDTTQQSLMEIDDSVLIVEIVPIDVSVMPATAFDSSFVSDAETATVSNEPAEDPADEPTATDVQPRKVRWQFANLVKPEPRMSSAQSMPDQLVPTKPVAATVRPQSLTAVASNPSRTQLNCLCQPSYPQSYLSRIAPNRVQYTSLAPMRSISSMAFPNSMSYSQSSEPESAEPADGLSDEEIRRRNAYSKAKNKALSRINKLRQRRERWSPPIRKRKTLNLAQYKAILASKYGINRLVEHYNSASSTAPFSMRHVGQYLGLGGGNLEGTGYSARSPYEALAVTSYANRGLPVLYRGVAKGRDGYYAYQIYRK